MPKNNPVFTEEVCQEIIDFTSGQNPHSVSTKELSKDLEFLRGIFSVDIFLRRPKSEKTKEMKFYKNLLSNIKELSSSFQEKDWLALKLMLFADDHNQAYQAVNRLIENALVIEDLLAKCIKAKEEDLNINFKEKADTLMYPELLNIYDRHFGNKAYRLPKGAEESVRGGARVRFIYKFFELTGRRKTDDAILKAISNHAS